MSSPDAASRRPRRRGSTELYVEHGHYYVVHADSESIPVPHGGLIDDKLLYPAPDTDEHGGAFVWTGTLYGPVALTVETYDSAEQAVPDDAEWEFREEAVIVAKGPNLRVETESGVEIELPQLHLAPGESAGVRLHARGFAEAARFPRELTEPDDKPIEHHLLQLWRA